MLSTHGWPLAKFAGERNISGLTNACPSGVVINCRVASTNTGGSFEG